MSASTEPIQVYFSPNGGCTDAIVREINRAKDIIRIQAYAFTSQPIAKAIIEAKKRGVKIEAVLDKSNRTAKYSAATFLMNQGVEVLIDDKHAIAHNKIILIDDKMIITGSFNFSRAAEESNAENLLVIRDQPRLMAKYLESFRTHRDHSEVYTGIPKREAKADSAADGAAGDGRFVGSRNSDLYHYPDCSVVKRIKSENLVKYASAPAGKRLHAGCPQ